MTDRVGADHLEPLDDLSWVEATSQSHPPPTQVTEALEVTDHVGADHLEALDDLSWVEAP